MDIFNTLQVHVFTSENLFAFHIQVSLTLTAKFHLTTIAHLNMDVHLTIIAYLTMITRDSKTVLEKWKGSFRDLLNVPSVVSHSDNDSCSNYDFNLEITQDKVRKAISRTKCRKRSGIDEIQT